MQSRLLTIGVWLLVLTRGAIIYRQWQQLTAVLRVQEVGVAIEAGLIDLAKQGQEPRQVDIVELSANSGRFDDVEGGFLQIAPLRLLDDDGEFLEFLRLPVSVSEPVDVRLPDAVDVYVTGGFVETD